MQSDFFSAVGLALLLGSIIGVERQWHRRLVDLKTNALVSLGACLFMLVTKTTDGFLEPVRMAAQIVVGVGFIGGGLLFRDGAQTKGINTAATLWCCAAVGTLCGLGRWMEATGASLVVVLANTVLRQVAQLLNLKMGVNDNLTDRVRFDLICLPPDAQQVRAGVERLFRDAGVEIRAVGQSVSTTDASISISVLLEHADLVKHTELLLDQMGAMRVTGLSWSHV
ncbi:MAG: MgtC/SapB family protein [Betaproteobacteria bacterium]